MSRLDPPQVLLDASALEAIVDPAHQRHADVAGAYDRLLEQYRREEVLLVAVGHHLRDLELGTDDGTAAHLWARVRWFVHRPHRGPFAPVEPLHVGHQHRRQAARMHTDPHDPEFALTILLCQRHGVRRVLTLDPRFRAYHLDLVEVDQPDGESSLA